MTFMVENNKRQRGLMVIIGEVDLPRRYNDKMHKNIQLKKPMMANLHYEIKF